MLWEGEGGSPGEAPRVLVCTTWELGGRAGVLTCPREGPRGPESRASFLPRPDTGCRPLPGLLPHRALHAGYCHGGVPGGAWARGWDGGPES